MADSRLVKELNKALGWELRAAALYAHYAAYVQGLESLRLEALFEEESTESMGHAKTVRSVLADLGAEAVTTRDTAPIVHTLDTGRMLAEALKTEKAAAAQYAKIMPLVKKSPRHSHALHHIMMDEQGAVLEFEKLMAR
jgi:bacterioferritin (cytochrome b1)